jgi:hypothetical protein
VILYALVESNTWELDPEEFYTDINVAKARSEELSYVLVAINIPDDGGPSAKLWSGMRGHPRLGGAEWTWHGPIVDFDEKQLDAPPAGWPT